MADNYDQDALNRALLMAAAATFQANDGRPFGSILGQGMFAGLQGYDASIQNKRKLKKDELETEKTQLEIGDYKRKLEDQKQLAEAYRIAAAGGNAAPAFAPGTRPSMAFTPEANAALPPSQPAPAPSGGGKDRERKMLQATIDALIAKGGGHLVGPLQDRLAKLDPEITSVREGQIRGQRVTIKQFKDGTEQVSPYDPEADKLHFADTGSAIQGLDPRTGLPRGPTQGKTMTPGEVASNSLGWANNRETGRHNQQTEANSVAGIAQQVTSNEGKLRDDYTQAAKPFVTVRDAHQRVLASAKDPSAAGDLALIFNYMKVLDPGSTVREGEFATAQNAGSVEDRVVGMYNRVLSGERLAPAVRNDMVTRSGMLYKAAEDNQTKTEEQFSGIATRGKMNPDNVVLRNRVQQPGGGVSVSYQGKTYQFPSAAAADGFKKSVGIP